MPEASDYISNIDFSRHLEFYKKHLTCDYEPVLLPETKTKCVGGISKFYTIESSKLENARRFAKSNGLTDTMFLLGAYGILLSKYSGKNEVLTSVILQNRTIPDTQSMVGMFANTIPMYLNVDGRMVDYYHHLKSIMVGMYQYQDIPFLTISEHLLLEHSAINTSFVYQPFGDWRFEVDGSIVRPDFIETNTSKFDLLMELSEIDNHLLMRLEINREKYTDELADRLANSYIRILEQMDSESVQISKIDILTEGERKLLLETFNETLAYYPRNKCIHELFMEQAKHSPDRTALVSGEQMFTYYQLDEMSNTLAYMLREMGIEKGDIVPLIAHRSWHVIVAILGILKAGGVYMPVSPDFPLERIRAMLETSDSHIALCYEYDKKLPILSIDLSYVDFGKQERLVENVTQPDDLCYVIFTSGSTGTPKGVCQTHKCIVNLTCEQIEKEDLKGKRTLATTTTIFDVSVQEIFCSLIGGGILYFSDDDLKMSPERYLHFTKVNKIDVAYMTPSYLNMLSDRIIGVESEGFSIGKIILAGEDIRIAEDVIQQNMPKTRFVNQYGPAETHVATEKIITDCGNITIGRPIANTQIYILDPHQNLLPIGVAGELCIAGDGVGKGYLNQPEMTAEKFIPNPFASAENGHGNLMYRTGDLAYWRADGEIEYLGRIDTQVKIRGLRIELGEIEKAMAETEGIGLIAAAARKGETGRQYLVGYYTSETEIDEKEMRKLLSEKLPKYMVPNYFVRIDKMPLTPSGKIDRKKLPLPNLVISKDENYVAPGTKEERILCGIMAELLDTERISVTDDFFELGGDSLSAIAFVSKAKDAGIDLNLQWIFDYPTVRELCEYAVNVKHKDVGQPQTDDDNIGSEYKCYSELLKMSVDSSSVGERKLGNVFLTGATGFLGAHILDELMRYEEGIVYCLVRNGQKNNRSGRLEDTLRWYFGEKYTNDIGTRIVPIVGNLERVDISDELPDDIQTVIHTAATVKHFGPYSYFNRVNVEGTKNVVNYAKRINADFIHISTIGLGEDYVTKLLEPSERMAYDETSFFVGQPLNNVYLKSKFFAEKVVLDEIMKHNLKARIIRVGNLTNRSKDQVFQKNYNSNAFLMRLKSMINIGVVPEYLTHMILEFSPVDLTAFGVVKIAQLKSSQIVFHLFNDKCPTVDGLLLMLKKAGVNLPVVAGKDFYERLQKIERITGNEYILESLRHYMNDEGEILHTNRFDIRNKLTNKILKNSDFEWKQIDDEYIRGYWEYFREIGYWKM